MTYIRHRYYFDARPKAWLLRRHRHLSPSSSMQFVYCVHLMLNFVIELTLVCWFLNIFKNWIASIRFSFFGHRFYCVTTDFFLQNWFCYAMSLQCDSDLHDWFHFTLDLYVCVLCSVCVMCMDVDVSGEYNIYVSRNICVIFILFTLLLVPFIRLHAHKDFSLFLPWWKAFHTYSGH